MNQDTLLILLANQNLILLNHHEFHLNRCRWRKVKVLLM